MTKTKAFFICLIAPIVVFGSVWLFLSSSVFPDGIGGAIDSIILLGIFWVLVLPVLLLATPVLIGKMWGAEFRKYGFYGSLASLPVIFFEIPLLSVLTN